MSWLVIIPLIVFFGADLVMYPGTEPISEIFAKGGARRDLGHLYPVYRRRRLGGRPV